MRDLSVVTSPLIYQSPSILLANSKNPDLVVGRADSEMSTGGIELSGKYKVGSAVIEIPESDLTMRRQPTSSSHLLTSFSIRRTVRYEADS